MTARAKAERTRDVGQIDLALIMCQGERLLDNALIPVLAQRGKHALANLFPMSADGNVRRLINVDLKVVVEYSHRASAEL